MKTSIKFSLGFLFLGLVFFSCKKNNVDTDNNVKTEDYRLKYEGLYTYSEHYTSQYNGSGGPAPIDTMYYDTLEVKLVGVNEIGIYFDSVEKYVFTIEKPDINDFAQLTFCVEKIDAGHFTGNKLEYEMSLQANYCGDGPLGFSSNSLVKGEKL